MIDNILSVLVSIILLLLAYLQLRLARAGLLGADLLASHFLLKQLDLLQLLLVCLLGILLLLDWAYLRRNLHALGEAHVCEVRAIVAAGCTYLIRNRMVRVVHVVGPIHEIVSHAYVAAGLGENLVCSHCFLVDEPRRLVVDARHSSLFVAHC